MQLSVIIAEPAEMIRKGLAALLRKEADFAVAGDCADGRQSLVDD